MLSILKKELKIGLKDPSYYIMLIIFPIVLIFVLSTTLGPLMSPEPKIATGNYLIVFNDVDDQIKDVYEEVFDSIDFLVLTEVESEEEARRLVEEEKYFGYINVSDKVEFFDSRAANVSSKVLDQVLRVIVQKFQLVGQAIEIERYDLIEDLATNENFISQSSLDQEESLGTFDYFGVTMLSLIIAWIVTIPLETIASDLNRKTLMRTKVAPISRGQIFGGKMLYFLLASSLQIFVIMGISSLLLGVNYISFPKVYLAGLSLSLLFVSIGLALASSNLSEQVTSGLSTLIIQVPIIIGGSYFPIDSRMGILYELKKLSPVGLFNENVTYFMLTGNHEPMINSSLINIGLALVILVIASLLFKRKDLIK